MTFKEAIMAAVQDGQSITKAEWPTQEAIRFDGSSGFVTDSGIPVDINRYAGGTWGTVPRTIRTEEALSLLSMGEHVVSKVSGRRFVLDRGIYTIGEAQDRYKASFSFEELCGEWDVV